MSQKDGTASLHGTDSPDGVAAPAAERLQHVLGDAMDPQSAEVRALCRGIRLEVFVGEQGVPLEEEVDALDEAGSTVHVLASGAHGAPLGTVRVLQDRDQPGEVHLGRLAVVRGSRGTGLGARLVAEAERLALVGAGVAEVGADGEPTGATEVTVVLSAQEQAMDFYARCGYEVVSGETYLDAGIAHQDMARTVTTPTTTTTP